jgi:hypothetical protein
MKNNFCTKCIFARALVAIQKLTERIYAKERIFNNRCVGALFKFSSYRILNRNTSERDAKRAEKRRAACLKGRKAEKRRDCASYELQLMQ